MFSVCTALSANFALVTASAANSVVPTAPAAISKVTSPNRALASPPTVRSEEVMLPSPVIAVPSTSNAPVATFCTSPLPATLELILAAVTASSASSFAVIPLAATSNVYGSALVPDPERTNVASVAFKISFPITPSTSVTVTEPKSIRIQSVPSHCITCPETVPSAIFSNCTASSANLALVTASGPSFVVTMERSSTLKGSKVVPAPVIVT
ncbi:hypothetical protein C21_04794 [Arenibacter sp. NBRC 103722]|nr:hypothetical protein C21_04794 [Arenibacter sp. NBRC 103722]